MPTDGTGRDWDIPLSPRELEVLQRIVEGDTNDEMAAALGIAAETVKQHVKKILFKLDVKNRAHAVTVAFRRGLVV